MSDGALAGACEVAGVQRRTSQLWLQSPRVRRRRPSSSCLTSRGPHRAAGTVNFVRASFRLHPGELVRELPGRQACQRATDRGYVPCVSPCVPPPRFICRKAAGVGSRISRYAAGGSLRIPQMRDHGEVSAARRPRDSCASRGAPGCPTSAGEVMDALLLQPTALRVRGREPNVSGLSALRRLLALECLDCILGFWMVVLFDVDPLTDQPSTDSDESDEQHDKADHPPKHRAYCEHQCHSVRLPSLGSAVITRCELSRRPGGSAFSCDTAYPRSCARRSAAARASSGSR
jgi:hypothetical protein